MRTKLIIFIIIICISISGCIGIIGRTSFVYDVTVSPVNGTAIIYVPIAVDEDGNVSEVMDNLTIYSYPDNVPSSNASFEIIETIHGKALEIVTDEPIRIKNKITQRGSSVKLNITLWNETFENSTGSIWMYLDGSSTAEDVSITFEAWYVQVFLAYGNGITIETNAAVPKNGWNTYQVYERGWG
ncbi:MAG: hypothetical protein U9N61_04260 [Euryarchaeota archaeon]|nr:hypothetical protein [Euryarchaeota archaeon]